MSASYKGNKSTEISALVLKFHQPQAPLESLLAHTLLGSTPGVSNSVGLGVQELSFLSPQLPLLVPDHTLKITGSEEAIIAVLREK